MEDLCSLRATCKQMHMAGTSPQVCRCLPLQQVLLRAFEGYNDAGHDFGLFRDALLDNLTSDVVGNPDACYLAGLREVFMDNRVALRPSLHLFERTAVAGHQHAAYMLALCHYRPHGGANNDDKAFRFIRKVEGDEEEAAAAWETKHRAEAEDADIQEEASNDKLDAIESFRVCHTNRKNDMSDTAREALESMEALREEPVADGTPPLTSAQVVSKVLSQGRSKATFLKNVGIQVSSRSRSSGEDALRSQLATEKEGSAILHEQMEELKEEFAARKADFLKLKQQHEHLLSLLSRASDTSS